MARKVSNVSEATTRPKAVQPLPGALKREQLFNLPLHQNGEDVQLTEEETAERDHFHAGSEVELMADLTLVSAEAIDAVRKEVQDATEDLEGQRREGNDLKKLSQLIEEVRSNLRDLELVLARKRRLAGVAVARPGDMSAHGEPYAWQGQLAYLRGLFAPAMIDYRRFVGLEKEIPGEMIKIWERMARHGSAALFYRFYSRSG